MDPETEFLMSKRESGNEWELFKENVRPLKRGRNVSILNNALSVDPALLKAHRATLIQAIHLYDGDDPLLPWLHCIKWVQEAFPSAGDSSGLLLIYEHCVRTFWHSPRYKDDLRYLKVWLEYARNCPDSEVIYSFLEANEIGKTHSIYYVSYALHVESKNKTKLANDVFNLGISRNAQPLELLKDAFRKFLARSMRRSKANNHDDGSMEKHLPASRSFGTILSRGENRMVPKENSDHSSKNPKQNKGQSVSLSIYKDSSIGVGGTTVCDQPGASNLEIGPWHSLGSRAERNKENTSMPSKWKTYKVPQKPGTTRTAGSSACIDVFVDEECEEKHKMQVESVKSFNLQLRQGDDRELKKETELLRENPLRNFPPNSLPR